MTPDNFAARVRGSAQQQTFFHFTDASNLPSIHKVGLLSRRELLLRQIDHVPGGNELSLDLDRHHGMDDYVHLCFRANHGMAHQASNDGRIDSLTWLKIDPAILSAPGTLIVLDNAVKNDVQPLPIAEALAHLDIEVLYTKMDWKIPAIRQRLTAAERYELLVPKQVGIKYIRS
jgi:hypothetical protein